MIAVVWPALVVTAASAVVAPTVLENVSVPDPTCVNVDVPAEMSFTVPPSVRLPLPPTLALALSVIAPPNDALPDVTINAPLEPTPAPLKFNGSAPIVTPSAISSVAPAMTVVPALVVPNAVAFCATKVPAAIVVAKGIGAAQGQRAGAALRQIPAAADDPRNARAVAIGVERAAAGVERHAAVRGEARKILQRPAAEAEPTRRIAEIGVGTDGKRPGADRRAPAVGVGAAQGQRAGADLGQIPAAADDPRNARAVAIGVERAAAGVERHVAVRGEARKILQRPKLSPPDVSPRLASVLTASVPPLIVVPPV